MRVIRAKAHQNAQAVCRLGMAAYWFDTWLTGPEEKFHSPPMTFKVSTKWYCGGSNRGGIRGNNVNPIRASPVVKASMSRHRRYCVGKQKNSITNTPPVTTKWVV